MDPLPICKWRRGGPSKDIKCLSPVIGPKDVTRRDCYVCSVIDHFDVRPLPVMESANCVSDADMVQVGSHCVVLLEGTKP